MCGYYFISNERIRINSRLSFISLPDSFHYFDDSHRMCIIPRWLPIEDELLQQVNYGRFHTCSRIFPASLRAPGCTGIKFLLNPWWSFLSWNDWNQRNWQAIRTIHQNDGDLGWIQKREFPTSHHHRHIPFSNIEHCNHKFILWILWKRTINTKMIWKSKHSLVYDQLASEGMMNPLRAVVPFSLLRCG